MFSRLIKVVLLIIFILCLIYGYYYLNVVYNIKIYCLFHKYTGLLCPGCGITRCIFSIINGNFVEAYNYNKLLFLLIPFIITYFIYIMYLYIFNKKDKLIKNIPNYMWYSIIIIVILFGIVRNII